MSSINKEKPLSASAWDALSSIARRPRPRQEFNPGVISKLESMALVAIELGDSPYSSHKPGTQVQFAVVTQQGRQPLDAHAAQGRH